MPLIALGVMGAVSGIVGAVGASKAAGAQAKAATSAADLQHQDQQAALAFQEKQWAQQQANEAPWLKAGGQAEMQLSQLTSTPGQGLLQNWNEQFQAPTSVTEQNDPGYQFRLQQGQQALENSAAARGGLLSGGTAKNIAQYSQDYASNEYANVYGRAFNEYSTRYNQFQQNQANTFNRLSSLAGGGQVAAGQLGQEGQAAAGNIANINLVGGQQQGNSLMNAGTARASGYAGVANSLAGIGNNASQLILLKSMGLLPNG